MLTQGVARLDISVNCGTSSTNQIQHGFALQAGTASDGLRCGHNLVAESDNKIIHLPLVCPGAMRGSKAAISCQQNSLLLHVEPPGVQHQSQVVPKVMQEVSKLACRTAKGANLSCSMTRPTFPLQVSIVFTCHSWRNRPSSAIAQSSPQKEIDKATRTEQKATMSGHAAGSSSREMSIAKPFPNRIPDGAP